MSTEEIQTLLQSVCETLMLIPTEDLSKHIAAFDIALNRADSIGLMLDPTGWIKARRDGSFDEARCQREIAMHLLNARVNLDIRNDEVLARIQKIAERAERK
jgi:hypothetical protein